MPRRDDDYMETQRGRILDAALKEFSARGYRGTSIRQIAQTAKLSTGALYVHFKNKDAIYRGLIKRRQARFPELSSGTIQDLFEAMRRSWTSPISLETRRLNAFSTQLGAEAAGDVRVARLVRQQTDEAIDMFAAAVGRDPRFAALSPSSQRELGRRLMHWWALVASDRLDNVDVAAERYIAEVHWGFEAFISKTLSEHTSGAGSGGATGS